MNILVIGSGGREHTICWKLKQSPLVQEIYCAPGNGGTSLDAVNVDLDVEKHNLVADFCREKNVDLVVVGPEAPLAVGITDDLEKEGIKVFGPSYSAARMESSKIFAKQLMGRYDIPTAAFRVFNDFPTAKKYIQSIEVPVVVKACGLAAGKGVIVAQTQEEAVKAAEDMLVDKVFGPAGEEIVVEEFLTGEEVSILAVTDGETVIPLVTSQDHKRAYDGDKGPNTGGMGAYSPAPAVNEELFEEIMRTIISPTIEGLKKEGITYKGVLYAGIMLTDKGPKVLEYNVRFGDPETQVILPRMKTDLADILSAAACGELSGKTIEWDERDCVCVVMASGGYPGSYEKGIKITGLGRAEEKGTLLFHAGTKHINDMFVTSGGRVIGVVGMGEGIREAIDNTYKGVEEITFDKMYYRKDIGHRALSRLAV